jgi:alpha-L-fucosidase
LTINRNLEGEVIIAPKKSDFGWKSHGIDFQKNLSNSLQIRYTTDGSVPNKKSKVYTVPFLLNSGEVKAQSFDKKQKGSLATKEFGLVKKDWTAKGVSNAKNRKSENAIDADINTYWNSGYGTPKLTIDLKKVKKIRGFIYTPPLNFKEGLIEKGLIKVSKNGKSWKTVQTFDLGNLINDPTARTVRFTKKVKARYVQIISVVGAGGSKSATIAEIDFLE